MLDTGVVILAHGSRVEETLRTLDDIVFQIKQAGSWLIEPATLQFNRPDLAEAVDRLVDSGAKKIVVLPMFLFGGNHVRTDIPEAVASIALKHSTVPISLGRHIGADDRLVSILIERLREAVGSTSEWQSSEPSRPQEIEDLSFDIIENSGCLPEAPPIMRKVIKRMVHASGDTGLAGSVFYSGRAAEAGTESLKTGAPIFTDVTMVAAGLSRQALAALGNGVICFIDDEDVRKAAQAAGITRSAAAVRKLARVEPEAVLVIGNAPTALREAILLNRRGELHSPLVIGMPVGFVGAAASKEELRESGLEHISVAGSRGGSPLAAAAANALLKDVCRELAERESE